MSLEKQYDDWVRGLMGGARAPSEEESRTARDSLRQMQAQLDALAAGQKRQARAEEANRAVQKAADATAESVRRMSSELTRNLRSDGLLHKAPAEPAPAAAPRAAGRAPPALFRSPPPPLPSRTFPIVWPSPRLPPAPPRCYIAGIRARRSSCRCRI